MNWYLHLFIHFECQVSLENVSNQDKKLFLIDRNRETQGSMVKAEWKRIECDKCAQTVRALLFLGGVKHPFNI